MFFKDETFDLPDDVFRLLRDYINKYCGMYFDDSSKYLLERRLSRRVKMHQFKSFKDYYHFLCYDRKKEEELIEVIDSLTTNETYFFREDAQLKAFIDEIVPEIVARKGKDDRTLRIWSAGCSTGEEPYTIAMMLIENGYDLKLEIDILGSDINQKVLSAARRGIYKRGSFRTTDDYYAQKYFKEDPPGNFKISDDVKKLVNFSYLNLFDAYKLRFIKEFDIIFCRNVIIYFDIASKKNLINTFHDKLHPGGYLLLGHAESLMNISTAFTLVHLKNDMVYQRPLESTAGLPAGQSD